MAKESGFEFFIVSYAKDVGLDLASITLISGCELLTVLLSKPIMGSYLIGMEGFGLSQSTLLVVAYPCWLYLLPPLYW